MEWAPGIQQCQPTTSFSVVLFPPAKPQPYPSLPLHGAVWSLIKEGLTHTTCYLIVKGKNARKV